MNTNIKFSTKKYNKFIVFTLNTLREINMSNSKIRSEKDRSITFRTSNHHYNRFIQAAEDNNMTLSAFIRYLSENHLALEDMNIKIDRLEKRLERRIFEMLSVIAGLDEQEHLKAKKTYLSKVKN